MFTQRCFIEKDTNELRSWLTLIGYQYGGTDNSSRPEYIYCNQGVFFEVSKIPARDFKIINCGDNEKLFQAIAALRNDSPFMQYFIYEKRTFVNSVGKWITCYHTENDSSDGQIRKGILRKATIEELIERFKI